MSNHRLLQGAKKSKEIILLIPILILAISLTLYPHLNYPYPLHVDEWFHIAEAKQIASNSKIDWFTGEKFNLGMERAWHLSLALIYLIFKPTVKQWIYLPATMHAISILAIFCFVSRLYGKKEALFSSLLIALLPSNVTMGGPVFLMPVNLSLIFIPIALLFAFELIKIKKIYNYFFLFLTATFLLYAHPPTALVLILILGIYLLILIFSREKTKALYLFVAMASSILLSLPNYIYFLHERGSEIKFNFWVYLQGIPLLFGIVPTLFFILGTYFVLRDWEKRDLSLLITSLILILNILFFTGKGFTYLLPYQRTFIPLFLIMSVIAGKGCAKLLGIHKPIKKAGLVILMILLAITICSGIERNISEKYYHLIDDEDYESFLWIKENIPKNATVLLDPWKARAFPAIAERKVYAVMPFGPNEKEMERVERARAFLKNECTNTSFLVDNNISVVYTKDGCQNEELIKVRENIYVLKGFG